MTVTEAEPRAKQFCQTKLKLQSFSGPRLVQWMCSLASKMSIFYTVGRTLTLIVHSYNKMRVLIIPQKKLRYLILQALLTQMTQQFLLESNLYLMMKR